MAFWNYFSKSKDLTTPQNERSVREISIETAYPSDLSGELGKDNGCCQFTVYLTREWKFMEKVIPQKLGLKRSDEDTAQLRAGFRHTPIDSWVEYGDAIIRSRSSLDPSVLQVVDSETYDHMYRSVTGDRFFRCELYLSQMMYDKLWVLLERVFSTPSSQQAASAILEIDRVSSRSIHCEHPYSGSLKRKSIPVETLRLRSALGSEHVDPKTCRLREIIKFD